jgi:hypothetical protein
LRELTRLVIDHHPERSSDGMFETTPMFDGNHFMPEAKFRTRWIDQVIHWYTRHVYWLPSGLFAIVDAARKMIPGCEAIAELSEHPMLEGRTSGHTSDPEGTGTEVPEHGGRVGSWCSTPGHQFIICDPVIPSCDHARAILRVSAPIVGLRTFLRSIFEAVDIDEFRKKGAHILNIIASVIREISWIDFLIVAGDFRVVGNEERYTFVRSLASYVSPVSITSNDARIEFMALSNLPVDDPDRAIGKYDITPSRIWLSMMLCVARQHYDMLDKFCRQCQSINWSMMTDKHACLIDARAIDVFVRRGLLDWSQFIPVYVWDIMNIRAGAATRQRFIEVIDLCSDGRVLLRAIEDRNRPAHHGHRLSHWTIEILSDRIARTCDVSTIFA